MMKRLAGFIESPLLALLVILQAAPTAALAATPRKDDAPPFLIGMEIGIEEDLSFPEPKRSVSAPVEKLSQPVSTPAPQSQTLRELLASEEDKAALAAALRKYMQIDADEQVEMSSDDKDDSESTSSNSENDSGFDQALVRRGEGFVQASCTECHDAERATSKRKTYSAWMATIRRMAAKEDADIPASQHGAIANYLASLDPANKRMRSAGTRSAGGNGGNENDSSQSQDAAATDVVLPPFTLNGTLSPVWRGTDPAVENKGFFPDLWLGVEWRPENSPISGKVTACTSCHGTNEGLGVELAEASLTLDLCHLITRCPPGKRGCSRWEAKLKAGRFIVPFGAFSSRVHPGALRTVSLPLMFNMGRRVGPTGPLQPVINLPYSDEGINLHLKRDLDWGAVTFDAYAVNGLQQGGPGLFMQSRSYRDNNSNVAVGARATLTAGDWKVGGSVAAGELQNDGAPLQSYKLSGADLSYRYEDQFRAYYEYAIRVEDSLPVPGSESIAYGNLIEMEWLLLSDPKMSFLARYDTLNHRGFFGEADTERLTYGLNFVLYGGSFLAINHEHWILERDNSINIMGLRWTVAF